MPTTNAPIKLSALLNDNLNILKQNFADCPDIILKQVFLKDNTEGCFIYTDGLVDLNLLQRDFVSHIIKMDYKILSNKSEINSLLSNKITYPDTIEAALDDILSGATVFFVDGIAYGISTTVKKLEKRSIIEPQVEKNVRGPHEGFIELSNVNISILRQKLKNSNLKFKPIKIGETSNQTITIAYINGIANPQLIKRLYEKISTINFDVISGAGYIEQSITDFPYSIFPQYKPTERPDVAATALLDGRLLIITEGTPVVLITPVNFFSFFKAPDDYNTHFVFGSLIGVLRFIAFLTALYLPGLYIMLTSFHYYMVPLNLIIPLAESRASVPFPPFVEAFMMEIIIEMLREASVRIPSYIGTSIAIVGGIIIGQAAVQAGLVSELLIITVAITAISSYIIPVYDMGLTVRIYRFLMMITSAIFGIIGVTVTTIIMFADLFTIESLGQPYFQPVVPFKLKDLKDTIIRFPLKYLKIRPAVAQPLDKERGKNNE